MAFSECSCGLEAAECLFPRCPEGDEDLDPCDHEGYNADILTGRATCWRCDHVWYLTNEDLEREARHEAEYTEWCAKEERREFWRKLTLPVRWPIYRLLERIWPRKSCSVLTDDEIPF